MSKLMFALSVVAGLGIAGTCAAQPDAPATSSPPMSHEAYSAAKKSADAQYELDRDACHSMSDNAREICAVEAKGKEKVAKAEAEAAYENTPRARHNARLVRAQADYEVSMERCGDFAGHRKDVCRADANAELVRAKDAS